MIKNNQKENEYPSGPSQQYGLRKSVPFNLSSALKNSNKITQKKTLAQISNQYQENQLKLRKLNGKDALIKVKHEEVKKMATFFPKKLRNKVCFSSNSTNLKQDWSQKTDKQITLENGQNINKQTKEKNIKEWLDVIKQSHQNNFHRSHSSHTLILKPSNSPLIKINKKEKKNQHLIENQYFQREVLQTSNTIQNTVNETAAMIINQMNINVSLAKKNNLRSPSFLNKEPKVIKNIINHQEKQEKHFKKVNIQQKCLNNKPHCYSSYIPQTKNQSNINVNAKRMSHYLPNQISQTQQLRLCINCEKYINKIKISDHENQCLGFKIILKMSNQELIDFLNQKITQKLHELKQIQQLIDSNSKQSEYKNYQNVGQLKLTKRIVDQILTDLDSIRLKALKRFHICSRVTSEY